MVKHLMMVLMLAAVSSASWANQDPTAPLGWQKPAVQSKVTTKTRQYRLPTLNSIVCNPDSQCVAVMNNQIVEQGKLFKGYRIAQINSEYVTLKRGSRQWKLEPFRLNIKQ
ncbi:MSHA biogenesis protein MshK [Vibrio sp. CAU 1672]|uniref:MSHA biogenesis protein MshK n=1 Tax=Vibrio sp. CAU 1672 TaxID=3032594 RepID=UPI0023DB3431|nr:MSHA biogenesis protein MshK [Vibrio sp. CAU 1672]MDF2155622.1 MSHA biogenesis protein MshK [Vibrio sp. CAU 1672]